ncbi:MAG: hypothetical protein ABJB98_09510 [Actinomycetota bacterium]
MNIVQTVLIFAGIPAAIFAVFALAVYGRSQGRLHTRYRPGRAWTFRPVWYLPHPDGARQVSAAALNTPSALAPGTTSAPAIETTPAAAIESAQPPVGPVAVGGASGEW